MAIEIRQQLKLSQQLVMTPQLQQAIKLLQLSRMELLDMVQQELEENPVLEEGLDQVEEKDLPEQEAGEDAEAAAAEKTEEAAESASQEEETFNDFDWQTYLEGYNMGSSGGETAYEEDDERPSFENLLTRKTTLAEHLLWQLNLVRIDDRTRFVAGEIIGNVDDDGYLQTTMEELVAATREPLEVVEAALKTVQEFDPPGIAARNLQECLLKQVEHLEMQGSVVDRILSECLKDLEARRYQAIARSLEIPLEDVFEAAKVIANFDPRPGSSFGQEDVHYIIPDIFVYKIGDEYVVVLNDEGLPNLRINSFYRSALSGGTEVDKKAGEFIQEKMRGAIWLIKSIHQRQRTI